MLGGGKYAECASFAAGDAASQPAAAARATAEQMSRAVNMLRDMKITINPGLSVQAPVFVPQAGALRRKRASSSSGADRRSSGVSAADRQNSASSSSGAPASSRLQDDLFDEFDRYVAGARTEEAKRTAFNPVRSPATRRRQVWPRGHVRGGLCSV